MALAKVSGGFRHPSNDAAGLLFITAKEAAKRAKEYEGTLGEELEAMTSVVLCVIVAEAAINEVCEWYQFHHQRPPFSIPHGLPFELDRLELRQKWLLLPMVARQRTFDQSSEPWQSFDALIELRNFIVHLKRRTIPKKVTGLLTSKLGASGLHYEVAKWACATISDMMPKLTELVEPPPCWMDMLWLWTPRHFPPGLSTPGSPWPDQG